MTKEELQGAIQYEAENYIPFKLEEVILDFCILGESLKSEPSNLMMDVLLIAVKKDEIYPLLQDFQNADTRVEIIDIDILAAMNAVEYFFPEDFKEKSIALLDIGSEISSICVIKQGKPKFIRDISFGGGDISKKLRRKLGMSAEEAMKVLESPKTASPEAQEILKEGYETLCSDLKLTIDYYLTEVQARQLWIKYF
jgi:type IV pilus assembly protein PilM